MLGLKKKKEEIVYLKGIEKGQKTNSVLLNKFPDLMPPTKQTRNILMSGKHLFSLSHYLYNSFAVFPVIFVRIYTENLTSTNQNVSGVFDGSFGRFVSRRSTNLIIEKIDKTKSLACREKEEISRICPLNKKEIHLAENTSF